MNDLLIYPIGSKVHLMTDDYHIDVTILKCQICPNNIQYEVMWWDKGVRKTEWVQSFELTTDETPKKKIGYHV